MEIAPFLNEYRLLAAPLIFLLLLAESAPVTGFFLPGVIILPGLGAMTGSGAWPFWLVYLCAVAGAVAGDTLGYWLGRQGASHLSSSTTRPRQRQAVEAAQRLVKERGVLAIIIGRFILLIHPALPPAIGFAGIRFSTFILVDTLASSLWVLLYMGAGHIVTGIWLKQIYQLLEIGSALVVLGAIVFTTYRYFSKHHKANYR